MGYVMLSMILLLFNKHGCWNLRCLKLRVHEGMICNLSAVIKAYQPHFKKLNRMHFISCVCLSVSARNNILLIKVIGVCAA